jgi:hypothetical protein
MGQDQRGQHFPPPRFFQLGFFCPLANIFERTTLIFVVVSADSHPKQDSSKREQFCLRYLSGEQYIKMSATFNSSSIVAAVHSWVKLFG